MKAQPLHTPSAADLAEAAQIFDRLRELTADVVGVSRASYGPGETRGLELIADIARQHGLDVAWDPAANLLVSLPGRETNEPAVLIGSHMDSVPRGGNFDGAAGIIAGLLCLLRMKRSGKVPPRTVRVIGLRGEESAWFGICYLGSRALFGALTAEDLASRHRDTSRPLSEYMRESGAAVDLILAGRPILDANAVAAYYELHIEQGPVMVARNLPVGIVTGIRGNIRYPAAKCLGEAGHSGAVPRWLRHDAVLATADLLHRMDEHWRVLLERGTDLVMTAGIFSTHPAEHAATRIPNEVTFSIDIRSQDKGTLESVRQLLLQECAAVARERRVEFALGRLLFTEPAHMDQALVRRLGSICDGLGVLTEKMPSGAGHDAAEFANHEIPSAMIFIRNEHGSHNPDEAMDIADFLLGTEVLYHAVSEDD